MGRPGFEPTIYVSRAILTNHTTTVESTTSMSYQRISSQLYQYVYFHNCSKHTDCTRSITKNYIFSVNTVIIYSCIKVRIRLILKRYTTITHCRQTHGISRKRHRTLTATRQQEANYRTAAGPLIRVRN